MIEVQTTLPKQTTNRVTKMMTLCSAEHLRIRSLTEPFCPCFCWTLRKVISLLLFFFCWGRLIHHQPSTVQHFDVFFFIFLNWAVAVPCISCWMSARDCSHEYLMYSVIYFSCFVSVLFSSICFNHLVPYLSYMLNRWLKYKFVFKGGDVPYALCHLTGWKLQ